MLCAPVPVVYHCCSPELSELHNQAALLLLFGHQHDAAAKHASDALDITQQRFGPTHPLTGHRLLRLGTIRWVSVCYILQPIFQCKEAQQLWEAGHAEEGGGGTEWQQAS
jgi:hypothetical protein